MGITIIFLVIIYYGDFFSFFFPSQIKPSDVGGVAGGDKFVVEGKVITRAFYSNCTLFFRQVSKLRKTIKKALLAHSSLWRTLYNAQWWL